MSRRSEDYVHATCVPMFVSKLSFVGSLGHPDIGCLRMCIDKETSTKYRTHTRGKCKRKRRDGEFMLRANVIKGSGLIPLMVVDTVTTLATANARAETVEASTAVQSFSLVQTVPMQGCHCSSV